MLFQCSAGEDFCDYKKKMGTFERDRDRKLFIKLIRKGKLNVCVCVLE